VADRFENLFKLRLSEEKVCKVKSGHLWNCQHIWHKRFGHRDTSVISEIMNKDLAIGFDVKDCGVHEPCVHCLKGKMSRFPFPKKSESKSKAPLHLVHTDVCGPINPATPSGTRYFLTIIDDYSRFTITYFMKQKSEVASNIKQYVRQVENQFGFKPKKIRSDQGGEYSGNALK
jgi:transposase InsO family protein